MKLNKIIIGLIINLVLAQVNYYLEPLSFSNNSFIFKDLNQSQIIFDQNHDIVQYNLNINNNDLNYITLYLNSLDSNISIFFINKINNSFIGPYNHFHINNGKIKTDPIKGNIVMEVNNLYKNNNLIKFDFEINSFKQSNINQATLSPIKRNRENPIILVTGYWPPTNEMIRHFSQDLILNPSGWQGDNWEESGYDIVSFFPSFEDPDCSSCGQGYGNLEVDYQDTSNDFWPIAESHNPIGIITFSRGYNNQSWELEFNAYNRTNWIGDYSAPTLPTPNPPDQNEESFFLRNSNLPMNEIIDNITNLNLGLDPYIDQNGDPGRFVSEFMAYHGTWYRDLHINGDDKCYLGGHVHVGGQIDWDTAKTAAEETIRTVITYLDEFTYTPGDVNSDEVIDILDLVIIINSILGNIELSNTEFYASDINEDSIINIQDIIILINLILSND